MISDTGDSVPRGAGGDSTAILAEMLVQRVKRPALVTLVHPGIEGLLASRHVGERVSLTVGGAVAMMHDPTELTGTLRHLGPMVVSVEGLWSPTVDFGFGYFAAFLHAHPRVGAIYFNGAKAEHSYRKHVLPRLPPALAGIALRRLPSTSPANASYSFERKLALWAVIGEPP